MGEAAPNDDGRHVVIIGAGIVGLILAQGLKKNGISFSIYEREESPTYYRAREWAMSAHWALPALEQMLPKDMFDRVQTYASVNPAVVIEGDDIYLPVFVVDTGEIVKKVPWGTMVRVSRRKMRALCAEGIDVQYNKQVRALRADPETGRPKVLFLDGTSTIADVVVGADGANSSVRSEVFPDGLGSAQKIQYEGVNTHVAYGDAAIAQLLYDTIGSSQCCLGVSPKGHWLFFTVQDVSDPDPAGWVFQLQWTWKICPETAALSEYKLSTLKSIAADTFAEPFKTFWTAIPDSHPIPPNRISIWPPLPIPEDVFRGHIALVGDAAHAMSFHRGQGLNHGITDVAKLVSVLTDGRKGLKEALDEYEAEMIPRAGEEVALSKMNTEMMHDWERMKESPFMKGGGTAENH